MSPEGKPKPNLPENRPNASVPETKLDAILSATRDRVASLRSRARELERRARATPDPRPFAPALAGREVGVIRSEEHTSELQSHHDLVCRLLLEKKKKQKLTRSNDTE